MPMKIFIGRSGKQIGEFELGDVRVGLDRGLFLPSDFGWYAGMPEWLPLITVVRNLVKLLGTKKKPNIPTKKGWRSEKPTDKQIRLLQRAGVELTTNLTRGKASDLIASLPDPFKKFTGKEIEFLTSRGIDLEKASMHECYLILESQK